MFTIYEKEVDGFSAFALAVRGRIEMGKDSRFRMLKCINHPMRNPVAYVGHVHLKRLNCANNRVEAGMCYECVDVLDSIPDFDSCSGCYGATKAPFQMTKNPWL